MNGPKNDASEIVPDSTRTESVIKGCMKPPDTPNVYPQPTIINEHTVIHISPSLYKCDSNPSPTSNVQEAGVVKVVIMSVNMTVVD